MQNPNGVTIEWQDLSFRHRQILGLIEAGTNTIDAIAEACDIADKNAGRACRQLIAFGAIEVVALAKTDGRPRFVYAPTGLVQLPKPAQS